MQHTDEDDERTVGDFEYTGEGEGNQRSILNGGGRKSDEENDNGFINREDSNCDDATSLASPKSARLAAKSHTASYEEHDEFARNDKYISLDPSSPGTPKCFDYQKGTSPRGVSYTKVKSSDEGGISPSRQISTYIKADTEDCDERCTKSVKCVIPQTPLAGDHSAQATRPTLSFIKATSPSLSNKSPHHSDLSLYASTSEGKYHGNSSAEADTFYSLENSPGKKVEGGKCSGVGLPDSERPGFSIFEDIILHGNVGDTYNETNGFNDMAHDPLRHFDTNNQEHSNTNANNQSDIFKGQILSRAELRENDLPSHDESKDIRIFSNRLSESYDIKSNISDTLESIPLTKEFDSDDFNDSNVSGVCTSANMLSGDTQPILPKRYILLFLLFLGFAVVYSLRVNINVAIVAMVNNKTRLNKNGRIEIMQAEFDWDSHTQALVLGSFYYGYWILQVPGAWIAMKLGATRIFGYGVLLSSLLSLITPVATRYHLLGIVGVRVAQGLVLGVTYPCVIAIWANWSPPLERSTMVTMTMAGSPVGNIIAIPITGILAKYGFDGGWPSVFYFFGFLGILWYIVWECVVYDKPENHPNISVNEKRFIHKSIGEKPFDPLTESLPWLAIFTSIPMWGIIFGHFGACWGYYTLFTQMPTYLKDVQHLDIKTMGLVAATPYLLKAFLGPVGGISADMLIKAKYLSIRGVRTLFYTVGCLFAGFFIVMSGYYDRKGEAIAFLILGIGFSGLNATGYAVNHLDLAPRYAGILMGISNTFATIPGFLSPMLTGFITKHKRASEWKIVFWVTFIVYIVAVILYTLMCSGEKQWWFAGYPVESEKGEEEEEIDLSQAGCSNEFEGDDKRIIKSNDDHQGSDSSITYRKDANGPLISPNYKDSCSEIVFTSPKVPHDPIVSPNYKDSYSDIVSTSPKEAQYPMVSASRSSINSPCGETSSPNGEASDSLRDSTYHAESASSIASCREIKSHEHEHEQSHADKFSPTSRTPGFSPNRNESPISAHLESHRGSGSSVSTPNSQKSKFLSNRKMSHSSAASSNGKTPPNSIHSGSVRESPSHQSLQNSISSPTPSATDCTAASPVNCARRSVSPSLLDATYTSTASPNRRVSNSSGSSLNRKE